MYFALAVTELVFEKFGVPGLYMHPSSVLTLYSVGHTTGVVVDAGGCGTRVMPVYEGCVHAAFLARSTVAAERVHTHVCSYAISSAVKEMSYGGRNLTKHFIRLLTERGCGAPARVARFANTPVTDPPRRDLRAGTTWTRLQRRT